MLGPGRQETHSRGFLDHRIRLRLRTLALRFSSLAFVIVSGPGIRSQFSYEGARSCNRFLGWRMRHSQSLQ